MENRIHDTAMIGPGVRLGRDNVVGPNVVLLGPLDIGNGNWFGPGCVIGAPPEIRGFGQGAAWDGELVGEGVVIGDGNVVREFASVHQGREGPTRIGNYGFLMNNIYVAHDCVLGHGVTLASSVVMGGRVHIGDGANLGLGVHVHQRRIIGPLAMVGMGTVVTHDIPPYAKAFGNPARVRGVNAEGLRRHGVDSTVVTALAQLYDTWDGTGDPGEPNGLPSTLAPLESAFCWYAQAKRGDA